MSLTDTVIRNTKPKTKDFKLSDDGEMYLLIKTNGGKYFRLDYRFGGKRKTLALSVYPETSLKQAREKRDFARKQLAEKIDPAEIRKETKIAQTYSFERAVREWLASTAHVVSDGTNNKKTRHFELYVFPMIGDIAVNAIKSPDVYGVLKPLINDGKLDTAYRIRSQISAAFAYCIAHGLTDYDPAQPVDRQLPPTKVKHRAAIIDPSQFAQLLRDIHQYQGTFVVQNALKFSPLVFQ